MVDLTTNPAVDWVSFHPPKLADNDTEIQKEMEKSGITNNELKKVKIQK